VREIALPRQSRSPRFGDTVHTQAASQAGVLVSRRGVRIFEARQQAKREAAKAKAAAEEQDRLKRVWSIVAPIMDNMGLDVPEHLLAAWREKQPDSYVAAHPTEPETLAPAVDPSVLNLAQILIDHELHETQTAEKVLANA
jgi:hypothetical protein